MFNLGGTRVRKKIIKMTLFSLVTALTAGYADNSAKMPIGRYLTIENKPMEAQINLLSQTIQVRFSPKITTIGDAINYILRFSGYSLISQDCMSDALKITLSKQLPAIDRHFGPMPLRDALITLAGPAFVMVSDPLNRTIDFHLKPQYVKASKGVHKTNHSTN